MSTSAVTCSRVTNIQLVYRLNINSIQGSCFY